MAMNGGIDQQINQKMDAYRGNPQQLMQRYQQNQQLVDLLALQKLKTEKEAAARDMQMKMQQQPQTIAQQREQEVLGLPKMSSLSRLRVSCKSGSKTSNRMSRRWPKEVSVLLLGLRTQHRKWRVGAS